MKKFFGMLLAAVSALVLLPGCGGGGDGDVDVMETRSFANGVKWLKLGGKSGQMTLYMTGDGSYGELNDEKVSNLRFKSSVGLPVDNEGGTCNYWVTKDDEGNIIRGTLELAYDNVKDQDVADFFGFQINNGNDDDDDNDVVDPDNPTTSSVLLIELKFAEHEWEDNQNNTGSLWVEIL